MRIVTRVGECEVWLLDLRASDAQYESALALLSHAERARARAIRGETVRRRFVLARAAVRVRLADVLGIAPERVALRIGEHGKPELVPPPTEGGPPLREHGMPELVPPPTGGGPSLREHGMPERPPPPPGAAVGAARVSQGPPRFNLSHGDGAALLAIHPRYDIGVDLERIAPESERPWRKLLERICHPSEAHEAMAEARAGGSRVFYERWVGKEAVLKALGLGLRASPASVWLRRDDGGGLRVEELPGRRDLVNGNLAHGGDLERGSVEATAGAGCGLGGWRLAAVPTPPGFLGAVALVDR
jgi:phosphopantetheinyl transferase